MRKLSFREMTYSSMARMLVELKPDTRSYDRYLFSFSDSALFLQDLSPLSFTVSVERQSIYMTKPMNNKEEKLKGVV